MKTLCSYLPNQSTNRRKFLKTTTVIAGMTAFGALSLYNVVSAAEKKSADYSAQKEDLIIIRGHHLFDMLGSLETGKTTHKTLGPIALKLRANHKTPLKIVVGMDDVCSPCEWWDHDKMICMKDIEKNPKDNEDSYMTDKNVIKVLGIKAGDVMNADDLYRLIKTKVTRKVFVEEVCVACRLVNICEKAYESQIEAVVKVIS